MPFLKLNGGPALPPHEIQSFRVCKSFKKLPNSSVEIFSLSALELKQAQTWAQMLRDPGLQKRLLPRFVDLWSCIAGPKSCQSFRAFLRLVKKGPPGTFILSSLKGSDKKLWPGTSLFLRTLQGSSFLASSTFDIDSLKRFLLTLFPHLLRLRCSGKCFAGSVSLSKLLLWLAKRWACPST